MRQGLIYLGMMILGMMAFLPARAEAAVCQTQTAQAGASQLGELYGASYALVIGINGYSAGWPSLNSAVTDARKIAKSLGKRGFNVTLCENLDRSQLLDELRNFFIVRGDDPDARLFVWFAGHGYTENSIGYIIPADTPLPEAGPAFRLKAIPMGTLKTLVNQAQAKHVYAVFDACFAGTIFGRSRALPPESISLAANQPVRQFLTSGDAFQKVPDDGRFAKLFLRAIDGKEGADANDDGYLTGSEIGAFLADRVTNLTKAKQTPRYGKLLDEDYDRGEFVFWTGLGAAPKIGKLPKAPATCPASEAAMMAPVRASFEAVMAKDFNRFAAQFAEDFIHRKDGIPKHDKTEFIDFIRTDTSAIKSSTFETFEMEVLRKMKDQAFVSVKVRMNLVMTSGWVGQTPMNNPQYRVACKAGAWRIAEFLE